MSLSFIRLSLDHYRRFQKTEFSFSESGVNLITGPNGSGKSTILEALYLLCMGKSYRDVRFSSLLYRTPPSVFLSPSPSDGGEGRGEGVQPFFRVQADLREGVRSVSFLAGSAVAYHDGEKSVRRSDLIGRPPVVLFSSESTRLVSGEPHLRRSWMDRILSQENPDYLFCLKRYTRTIAERNALLKSAQESPPDPGAWMALDETLAQDGDVLMAARRAFVDGVASALPAKFASLGTPALAARIRIALVETAAGNLLGALIDHRSQDLAVGHTTVGPHRDDVRFLDAALPAVDILSHGEIRILSLALMFIEVDRLSQKAAPVLLVDELFAELDEMRRQVVSQFLMNSPGQIFLTSCLPPPADLLAGVRQHITL